MASPAAWADAASEAEVLLVEGVKLREQGRDEEALAVFKRALAKAPSARARAQVALAEQALGMWVIAEADLQAALSEEGDPWIQKNRAALDRALAAIQKRLSTLEVRGAEDAEVYVDGLRLGRGAGPYRVEAGKRSLEVRAAGHRSVARSVDLAPGGMARETVVLVAESSGSAAPAPGSSSGGPPGPADPGSPPGTTQRIIGWTFAGTGAALLATGLFGALYSNARILQHNEECPGLGTEQPVTCTEHVKASRTWHTISILSFVSGGAFTAGGAALLFTAPSAARDETTAKAWVTCGPSSAPGIACAGAF